MGPAARADDVRALAARAATDSIRAAAGAGAAERLEGCVRELEAEKAKMEVFRRELPISVRLVADVIEWIKDDLAQRKAAPEGGRAEADDMRSWMSSAQLWTCGGSLDHTTGNNNDQAHKVSNASVPPTVQPSLARSTDAAPLPDLSLSSPATAPSAAAATDAGARRHQQQQQAQRKARRCWSPELHRRFVAALQRLGGAQAATPKQIRELMKVDGLTNDEVKSHLQKYRLHTRRGGGDQQAEMALWSGSEQPQQYTASQHSSSPQSDSPQGPLQLTVSMTGADSCDGDGGEEDGRSEGYSWEMQQPGTKPSSS